MKFNRLILVNVLAMGMLACSAVPFLASTRTPAPTVVSITRTLPPSAVASPAIPTVEPTQTSAPLQLPTTTFDSIVYADPNGRFAMQYPQGWVVKDQESEAASFCESNAADSPCFTVQLREASGDVQAFADEILIGLESSVSDYFAAPPFQSTTGDNLPIIWNYVEYTYQDSTRAGQLAFVVNGQQGYYISALASLEAAQGLEGLFTEMILTMRFGG